MKTNQPNKERIRLLVDALRSGKYRQGKGYLSVYDKQQKRRRYCCLGVACEVAKANGLELTVQRTQSAHDASTYYLYQGYSAGDKSYSSMPQAVVDWYGFGDFDPYLPNPTNPYRVYTAIEHNDDHGLTLRQIADLFEAKYLKDDNNNN